MNIYGEYFYGNKISEYGLANNRVDYGTLAKAFDAVLNNDIMNTLENHGYYFEQVSGVVDNSEEIEELENKLENDDLTEEEIEEIEEEIEQLKSAEEYGSDIFQFYIVSGSGAELLQEINEIVFYNEELNIYIWGVDHYGTNWNYVLTDIPCNTGRTNND